MKRIYLTVIACIGFVCLSYAQDLEKSLKDIKDSKGFNNASVGDTYGMKIKKGGSDFKTRAFTKGYKYFIAVQGETGIKNLDFQFIDNGTYKTIGQEKTTGNKNTYYIFVPKSSITGKMKVKIDDAVLSTKAYGVKIWVYYKQEN